MNEIEQLEARYAQLNTILETEPLSMAEALAISDEMIELDCALQRLYAPLETLSDARLCLRFDFQI